MNVILTLTLTGSCMVTFYCIVKNIPKRYLGHYWGYAWIKLILMFYLIPLPFLKKVYQFISRGIFGAKNYGGDTYFNDLFDNGVYLSEGDALLSTSSRRQVIICIVWFAAATLILLRYIIRYLHHRKLLLKNCISDNDKRADMMLAELKQEYGIQRNVMLHMSDQKMVPFSIGILKPVIILSKRTPSEILEVILRHELVHIKRYDTLFQALDIFVLSIHWFNPLIYWLIREKERTCEMSCDDVVVKNMELYGRINYAAMIAGQAVYGSSKIKLKNNLSKGGKKIEERIVNIMDRVKKKKLRGAASASLIGLVTFLSSLTVFAYKNFTYFDIQDAESLESKSYWMVREGYFMNG